MNSFLNLCFGMVIACALYGCSGGGESGDETIAPADSTSNSGSSSSTGSNFGQDYLVPGSYVSMTSSSCLPFEGSENAELKILFINLNGAPYFDTLVEDAVYNQFKTIAPFSEYFASLAFYKMEINDGQDYQCVGIDGGAHSGSSLNCNDDKIHQAIMEQCPVDDIHGLIKVVFASSPNGGAAGEVIYIGANPEWTSADDALHAQSNTVVHEVGHNFGLADLYGGGFNRDGTPVTGWPSDMSRQWGNLDAPGCSKWCNGFKPASEYTLSTSAACPGFGTKSECLAFNRDAEGTCSDDDGDGHYDCCSWSEDQKDDYFKSSCAPVWGAEDIGLNCEAGAGCYYGGAYGTNSWRPVKSKKDSIMYNQHYSDAFDSVSERELRETLRCCASSDDGTASCADFRNRYVTFLDEYQPYKQRLGSCGRAPSSR